MKKDWVLSYPLSAQRRFSDQTGRMPMLIWVSAGRTVILMVLSWGSSFSESERFQTLKGLVKRELVYMPLVHLFVYLLCVTFVVFSSSWCHGLAAACDCDTPCTFHLTVWDYKNMEDVSPHYRAVSSTCMFAIFTIMHKVLLPRIFMFQNIVCEFTSK